jgi:hypothetical protein
LRIPGLWTQNVLRPARHIYEQAGYHLASEEPHASFGADLVAEMGKKPVKGLSGSPPEVDSVRR